MSHKLEKMRTFHFTLIILFLPLIGFCQSDWELQRDKKGIKVWTKDYPDSNFKQFKATCHIDASMENVVALFQDINNLNKWYDRVETTALNRKISDQEAIYTIDFDLPWPVTNRVTAVKSTIKLNPTNGQVKVITEYEANIITPSKGDLLVTNVSSDWILTPNPNGGIDALHLGYMDPAGSLPAWIANKGVKDGPINTITGMKKLLPKYETVDVTFID